MSAFQSSGFIVWVDVFGYAKSGLSFISDRKAHFFTVN
jgi:hypothetical protein